MKYPYKETIEIIEKLGLEAPALGMRNDKANTLVLKALELLLEQNALLERRLAEARQQKEEALLAAHSTINKLY